MSNPIADTADYFARWKQYSQQQQDSSQDELLPHHLDSTQQQSSSSRSISNMENNQSHISTTIAEPPRSQWLRVLNRISFLNPLDTSNSGTDSGTNYYQDNTENEGEDDDSINNDRDTFELMRAAAVHQKPSLRHHSLPASRHHSLALGAGGAIRGRAATTEESYQEETLQQEIAKEAQEEEEKLPSAYDLENDQINPLAENHDESSHYFTHPFFPDSHSNNQGEQPIYYDTPAASSSRRSTVHTGAGQQEEEDRSSSSGGGGGGVKDKWDRTLDKLKLIANLQQTQQQQQQQQASYTIPGPSHTLATWYPPAFDPIFAAFAKDEYGRNVVK